MPHRRKREKGSFGAHFDELVKHFHEERTARSNDSENERSKDDRDFHDRLFEIAWRASHEGSRRAD
jgi:hypothetical protein